MNHPHEQQAAAMARAGELPDGEQLRECINSGQVSAAQAVAHAEAEELPPMPRPAVNAFADISESFLRANHFTATQMRDYAQAARSEALQEAARLREALTLAVRQNEHDMLMTGDELRICCAALAATQQGASHE